ncbi:MAG: Uma2 family endonuclease, partial [Lewinella sp.]|nr:Uma2 family endonuclease [Lewinella sp.]
AVKIHQIKKHVLFNSRPYAEGGVKEYWIINLVERQFEIYTVPNQGGTYGEQAIHQEGSTFEHKLLGTIEVSELLPGIISARK